MCKIIAFTNSTKLNIKEVSTEASKLLLETEKDGFGYAVQGKDVVFGEKCIAPFFTYRMTTKNEVKLPIVEIRQNKFGHYDKPTGGSVFHGRTSTNDKGLLNCHPMQREGWHLIHNGVVTDYGPVYNKTTTNDSEDVVHRLSQGIKAVEEHLSGYYAFAALGPDGNLHIAKDSVAQLYVAWINSLQTYIFATTRDLIEELCEALEVNHGPIDMLQNDIYMVFKGNEMLSVQTIKPRGWTTYESRHASKSLGRSLHDWESDYGGGYTYPKESYYDATKGESLPKDSDLSSDEEHELTELMMELDNMDAGYVIKNGYGESISAHEFYKLDMVSQCECTITRPDGTRVDAEKLYEWAG